MLTILGTGGVSTTRNEIRNLRISVGKVRKRWLEKTVSGTGVGMMKAVKQFVDPSNIFNNGNCYMDDTPQQESLKNGSAYVEDIPQPKSPEPTVVSKL